MDNSMVWFLINIRNNENAIKSKIFVDSRIKEKIIIFYIEYRINIIHKFDFY